MEEVAKDGEVVMTEQENGGRGGEALSTKMLAEEACEGSGEEESIGRAGSENPSALVCS